jgi:hypothetical protein
MQVCMIYFHALLGKGLQIHLRGRKAKFELEIAASGGGWVMRCGIATWERRTCEIKRAFGARDENNEQRERAKERKGWEGVKRGGWRARMHNRDMDRKQALSLFYYQPRL